MGVSRRGVLAGAAALSAPGWRAWGEGRPSYTVGVLTDLSGQYRDNAGPLSVLAAQQAVEDFAPRQRGFDVRIVSADHQLKSDVGSAVARQWFDQEGVDAIADLNNTAIALAVGTIAREKDRALLITGAASADLTGAACSANAVHFAPDTYADSHSTGNAVLKAGGDKWFLIVADYVFGHNLERDISVLVQGQGGRVVGAAAYPFPGTTDFSSYLLQAQASGANVLGLCNTGGDVENCVKQAHEFGLPQGGMTVAALLTFVTEMKSIGLDLAQGLRMSDTFYWDLNERTRAFTRRFLPKTPGQYPSSLHASCYAGVTQYLKALASLGAEKGRSGRAAIAAMKAMPTDDDCFGRNSIREDGRFLCPVTLFRVKAPGESRSAWDVLAPVSVTPGAEAFRPMGEGHCPLVRM